MFFVEFISISHVFSLKKPLAFVEEKITSGLRSSNRASSELINEGSSAISWDRCYGFSAGGKSQAADGKGGLPSTKLTYPTWGSSENHRLKMPFWGDMLVSRRVYFSPIEKWQTIFGMHAPCMLVTAGA